MLTEPIISTLSHVSPVSCIPNPPVNNTAILPIPETLHEEIEMKPVKTTDQAPAEQRPKPFTAPWLVRRIKEDRLEDALTQLRIWMPDKRRPEATEELIRLVASMDEEDALQAVYELRSKRRYIKGTKGRELKVPALLQTIDSLRTPESPYRGLGSFRTRINFLGHKVYVNSGQNFWFLV